jgi:hypothetical protein
VKKACVFPLALYLGIAAIVAGVVYRRFPESGPALMAGFIGGFIVWLGVAYLLAIPGRIGEARITGAPSLVCHRTTATSSLRSAGWRAPARR